MMPMRRPAVVPAPELVTEWEFLPFRFHRFRDGRVLLTNLVGEHLFVSSEEFIGVMAGDAPPEILARLRAKHLVRARGDDLPVELLAVKLRTKYRRLPEFTALHIFVVSLRCEHTCRYCQVSRQTTDKDRFDMSEATARRALEATFRSPSSSIKIEFQGGEPLLNFGLVKMIVAEAQALNEEARKNLAFVITTNLALVDDDVLAFCGANDIFISTSLDGPKDLHNASRHRPGDDSFQRTVDGIRRVKATLGRDHVAALMTTTEASLSRVKEIIDCYVQHDLNEVFLRPISPYGFAVRGRRPGYDVANWLAFYEEGLRYILELNARGVDVVERYAALILRKMLTNDDPGYVDLMSPAGIGIGAIVYNYDGDVYASDEGRMLAEMGDKTFRLGNLHEDTYEQIVTSDALLDPLEQSIALSAPMCSDCAFEPYCGADPVFHHATTGDYLGRKPESPFCNRNMGVFKLLLDLYETDTQARVIFRSWSRR